MVLFVLTVASTYWVGGPLYSMSIMTILLSHEMGHYLMSRRHGVPATLPYFIPFPPSPFGTFGAVIKMGGVIYNKRSLFDIGVAGPLCGFILAVPAAFIGVHLSTVVRVSKAGAPFRELGDPLLFRILEWYMARNLPPTYELVLHPIGYAAWVGLFVTALNLLPVGQLDGGHIIYAVFGRRSAWVYRALIPILLVLSFFYNAGWLVLVVLLLIFGIHHPRPVDEETPLNRGRKVMAVVMLAVFVLSFTPAPFPGNSLRGIILKLVGR